MKRIVVVLALCALVLPAAPAAAARRTDTNARVSDSGELENFGLHTMSGYVRGAREGQRVRFSYKRPNADEWRPFKVAGDDGADGTGFFVLNRKRPVDKVDGRGRFSVDFTPSVAPGRWLLRAVFPAQDGFAKSADVVRVEVSGGD